jgi:hypothetical protein
LFRGVLVGFSHEEFGRGEAVQGVLLGRSVDPDETGDTIYAMLLKMKMSWPLPGGTDGIEHGRNPSRWEGHCC